MPSTEGNTAMPSTLPKTTDVLIVGGGPVGIMAAISLARYGYSCTIFERHAIRMGQPKAHVINSRSLEIFRQHNIDILLLRALGLPPNEAAAIRFVSSIFGTEFGAIQLRGDGLVSTSPELTFNVPQPCLEEHLSKFALATGKVTFLRMHEWLGCIEEPDKTISSEVLDRTTNTTHTIKSKYLIGCDGANARSRDVLEIAFEPLNSGPIRTLHYASVHFSADLSHLKPGLLWFIISPTGMGVFIAYNRRNSWVYFIGYDPAVSPKETFTSERFKDLVFQGVGKPLPDYKELGITMWTTMPKLAKTYRSQKISNAFLAGDAAHCFPPTGGLGVNTGMADVQNLAWKIDAVEKGWASDSFLDTISAERLPVAKDNCRQSKVNEEKIFNLVHVICKPGAAAESLCADPVSRKSIQNAIAENHDHFDSINLQLGYVYGREHVRGPSHYEKELAPGARLPHCWLDYGGRKVSTLDLITGFGFVLITIDGFTTRDKFTVNDIPVSVAQCNRDFVDTTGEWTSLLESIGHAAVLVRPDQHIVGTIDAIEEARALVISCLK